MRDAEQIERLLDFIDSYWATRWTSPTVREIGDHMGWSSPSTAHAHLLSLERDGHLDVQRVSDRRVLYRRAVPA